MHPEALVVNVDGLDLEDASADEAPDPCLFTTEQATVPDPSVLRSLMNLAETTPSIFASEGSI